MEVRYVIEKNNFAVFVRKLSFDAVNTRCDIHLMLLKHQQRRQTGSRAEARVTKVNDTVGSTVLSGNLVHAAAEPLHV